MKNAILITPDDKIEIKEYINYHTINDLVGGWYETCGYFGITDQMCMIFCNEEFLLQEDTQFNAVGTCLANQPIYGNIVLLADGYNDEGERDALPLNDIEAQNIFGALNQFVKSFDPILKHLHSKYDDNKPKPITQVSAMSEEEFNEILMGDSEDE